MGSQSAPQPPKPITPGQAAQAAVGTAAAGEMMSVANQPIEQYGNLYTTGQLGPAEVQTQTALANRAAMQSAQGQLAIQSQVDPLAYAQRQMRLKAATDRLGQLYGTSPSAFSFSAPGAFVVPGTNAMPSLSSLRGGAADVARNLATASVNYQGANPTLNIPSGTNLSVPTTTPRGYY